ncbi:ATP-binding cassette domain-containing protein [Puteibacter caeruleilacunae]|nr:ATP-binding cassette domain-containing protein [Puteibacter caeruleilacunae]
MDFIINRKTLISMLFIGLSLLGYISYKQLPVELLPSVETPVLYVQITSSQEVDPRYMENQAVIPVEGAIETLEGIEEVRSWIDARRASVVVNFSQSANFKYSYLKLQEKIDQIKSDLPDEFNVQVTKVDMNQLSNEFMELQVRGSGGVDRVRNIVDQKVKPDLENIDGIASANVFGGREKSIEVIIDKDACDAYNITPSLIQSKITKNSQGRTFTGYLHDAKSQYFVHVTAEYDNVRDIENVVLADGPILLKDVADVVFGVKEETSFSRVNGKEAISVLLVNDSQANLIELSHRTDEVLKKLNEKLAKEDIEIIVKKNSAQDMEQNIDEIIKLALVGGLLAVFVLWMFLKNIRLVSFIGLAIPISVYTAFNFFYAFDISINSLTLVGMALAIGMLLDNSVVVLENIYRLASQNRSAHESAVQGTEEVWRSIFAATLTTITVFLPFVFSDEVMIRVIGNHVGVSIISTLVVSLFVALLLIPMAAHFLLKRKKSKNIFYEQINTDNRILQIYVLLLKTCMRRPLQTILGGVIVFFVTMSLALVVSVSSLKEIESDQFTVYVTMSSGSTLEATDKIVQEVEKKIEDVEEIKDVICKIQEEEAIITLSLKDEFEEIAERGILEIKDDVEKRVKAVSGAEISLSQPTSSKSFRGGGNPMENFSRLLGIGSQRERILIKGQDYVAMRNVAEDIKYFIDELESVSRTSLSSSSNRPEVHLKFKNRLLTEYELTLNNIVSSLRSFSSEFSSGAKFKHNNEEYDILIREKITDEEEEDERQDKTMEDLKKLEVANSNGGLYEMHSIANIVYSSGMASISRVNQEKQIELRYSFQRDASESNELLESYRMEIDDIVAAYNLPSGVAVEVIHEEDEFSDFKFLIAAAFILIFMIMASVFESISTPFVLMFSIPLAAIGSFLGLIFTGNSLINANTLTGFLILLGVVVNNGIILIDYSNILRKRGYSSSRALITAGISRVRPILITAVTTIVAMFPLAMGQAEYVGAIGAPFAITVIGGLALSTILTLVFIPTFHFGLENALKWIASLDWITKTIQLVVILCGLVYIYFQIDKLLWQLINIVLLVLLVPGSIYFIKTSLRRAKTKLIEEDAPLTIKIRKLVKIYDRDNQFTREWKGGIKMRERKGLQRSYDKLQDFRDMVWQIPLFCFLVYFTFIYINSGVWMFLLSHVIYFSVLALAFPIKIRLEGKENPPYRLIKIVRSILVWGMPVVFLTIFVKEWDNIGMVILVGTLWYMALAIYATSKYLHDKNINVERITGRFGGLRRAYFRTAKKIPVIGKRKKPFRALSGVSFDIETGMIGLLGPNGAGKSTMMRIICGIFEQSYGKVYINGIDTQKKREELQGLIGYLPQEFGTYENMSSWEFLDYQGILKGITNEKIRHERIEYVLKAVHMFERKDDKIGSFSGGMKQRIGIAQILLHLPRILVVDEPTAGLDPRERIRFRNLLVELSRERIVIFSTHIIEDISSSCNQVAVINKGELKYTGAPNNMVNLGEGFVWTFTVEAKEFDDLSNKHMIVNHMRDGENIKVRCISKDKPREDAVNVPPFLEEAYLCLLKDIR